MRFLTSLVFFFASVSHAATPVVGYPSGNDIKLLKTNIDLNGQAKILSGTVDPTLTATNAPKGSVYFNTSNGLSYRKTDAGSTINWVNLAVGNIQQASFFGGMEQAGSSGCSYSVAVTNYTPLAFGTNASCTNPWVTSGNAVAVGTTSTQMILNNLKPGQLNIVLTGGIYAGGACYYSLYDGTNSYQSQGNTTGYSVPNIQFSVPVANGVSSLTFTIRAGSPISSTCGIENVVSQVISWKAYYFPTDSMTVLSPALTPAYAGKQWVGASPINIQIGASVAASNTRTTLTSANFATYTLLGSAQNDASTNAQMTATYPAGEYEVDFTSFMRASSSAGGTSTNCVFEIYDGTSVLGSNLVGSFTQAAQGVQDTQHVRGYFKLATGASKTVSVRVAKTAGDSSANSYCQAYIDSAVGTTASAMLTVKPTMQSLPIPVIANSVVSSSAGVERVERAKTSGACSTTPCTISNQSGGVSTITRAGAGNYTVNFTTPFSTSPSCVCQVIGSTSDSCRPQADEGTSSVLLYTGYASDILGALTLRDVAFRLICQGPK